MKSLSFLKSILLRRWQQTVRASWRIRGFPFLSSSASRPQNSSSIEDPESECPLTAGMLLFTISDMFFWYFRQCLRVCVILRIFRLRWEYVSSCVFRHCFPFSKILSQNDSFSEPAGFDGAVWPFLKPIFLDCVKNTQISLICSKH